MRLRNNLDAYKQVTAANSLLSMQRLMSSPTSRHQGSSFQMVQFSTTRFNGGGLAERQGAPLISLVYDLDAIMWAFCLIPRVTLATDRTSPVALENRLIAIYLSICSSFFLESFITNMAERQTVVIRVVYVATLSRDSCLNVCLDFSRSAPLRALNTNA